jgi:hypothetical protein
MITEVTLTFTPILGGADVVVSATDSDGDGIQDLVVSGPIVLNNDTEYSLTLTLINGFAEPTDEEYDITAEVEEEGDEHQFFFEWTGSVFSNPTLSGNIYDDSNPSRPLSLINYIDLDLNDNPVGLETEWTTNVNAATGSFRIILKHQPDGTKTATSNSGVGDSDIDLTFDLEVQ